MQPTWNEAQNMQNHQKSICLARGVPHEHLGHATDFFWKAFCDFSHACHDMAAVFIQIHRMGVPSMSVFHRIKGHRIIAVCRIALLCF